MINPAMRNNSRKGIATPAMIRRGCASHKLGFRYSTVASLGILSSETCHFLSACQLTSSGWAPGSGANSNGGFSPPEYAECECSGLAADLRKVLAELRRLFPVLAGVARARKRALWMPRRAAGLPQKVRPTPQPHRAASVCKAPPNQAAIERLHPAHFPMEACPASGCEPGCQSAPRLCALHCSRVAPPVQYRRRKRPHGFSVAVGALAPVFADSPKPSRCRSHLVAFPCPRPHDGRHLQRRSARPETVRRGAQVRIAAQCSRARSTRLAFASRILRADDAQDPHHTEPM